MIVVFAHFVGQVDVRIIAYVLVVRAVVAIIVTQRGGRSWW